MIDYRRAIHSDGFFSYRWILENGNEIPIVVSVRDVSEARQSGLNMLDWLYDYERSLHYRKAIEKSEPILVGPYTGIIKTEPGYIGTCDSPTKNM
jgi:hypothetical protein